MENRTLSIRKRKKGDIGSFTLDELLKESKAGDRRKVG